jgi:hypothetical protein
MIGPRVQDQQVARYEVQRVRPRAFEVATENGFIRCDSPDEKIGAGTPFDRFSNLRHGIFHRLVARCTSGLPETSFPPFEEIDTSANEGIVRRSLKEKKLLLVRRLPPKNKVQHLNIWAVIRPPAAAQSAQAGHNCEAEHNPQAMAPSGISIHRNQASMGDPDAENKQKKDHPSGNGWP